VYRREREMTTFQYVRSLMHRQHFSVASATDPGPLFLAMKPRFSGLWRRIRRRLGLAPKESVKIAVPQPAEETRTPAGTRS